MGAEFTCALTEWLTLASSFALILYPEGTRHSATLTAALQIHPRLKLFTDAKFLRDAGADNDLVMTCLAFFS